MSTTAPHPNNDAQAVLRPFLDVLRPASPITLPRETLYGAITHFLSTLPPPHLTDFIAVLVSSPSLWNSVANHFDQARHAVRLAVSAKVSGIDHSLQNVYFSSTRRRWIAQSWLNEVVNLVTTAEESRGRIHFSVGLLQGLGDVSPMDWGSGRIKVEEEVVLSLDRMLKTDGDESMVRDGLKLLSSSVLQIAEERLRVLQLKVYFRAHQNRCRC